MLKMTGELWKNYEIYQENWRLVCWRRLESYSSFFQQVIVIITITIAIVIRSWLRQNPNKRRGKMISSPNPPPIMNPLQMLEMSQGFLDPVLL